MNVESQQNYEDAIDLFQFMGVLWRRKAIIIGTTIAAVVLAVILSLWVLPKQYESTARFVPLDPHNASGLGVGLPSYVVFGESDRVLRRTLSLMGLEMPLKEFRELIHLRPGSASFEVTVKMDSPLGAQRLLQSWRDAYSSEAIRYIRDRIDQRLLSLDRVIAGYSSLSDDNAEIAEAIDSLTTPLNSVELVERFVLHEQLIDARSLRERLLAIRESLDDTEIFETLVGPTFPEAPVWPLPILNSAIAAFLGLFFSVGATLFREAMRHGSAEPGTHALDVKGVKPDTSTTGQEFHSEVSASQPTVYAKRETPTSSEVERG